MKKIFVILAILVTMIAIFTIGVSAATYSGDCSATTSDSVTWSLNTSTGVLTISGTGAMRDYVGILSPWFSYRSYIKTVSIGNSVTRIGDEAFDGCDELKSVTIGNRVDTIGSHAFSYCTGLTSITIPNSVTSIGSSAFYTCIGLTSITIPSSVTSIGSFAFYNCDRLTSINIPSSVTSIGADAFYNCSGLTAVYINDMSAWCNISFNTYSSNPLFYAKKLYLNGNLVTKAVIPNTVKSIGAYVFHNYTLLTSVTIPDSITSIGEYAFYECTGLTSITIPSSVKRIDYRAFYSCTGLTGVYINDIGAWCNISFSDSTANPLYHAKKLYLNDKLVTKLVVPDSITNIGSFAFSYCTGLTSVTIGNDVETIGDSAFANCTAITSISIPNNVKSIGSSAFYYCTGLKSVTIGSGVETIGNSAFNNCTGITSITIPYNVKSIGSSAFRSCTRLKSVTIPESITSISPYMFYNCKVLASVTIPNSVMSIDSYAFANCAGLKSVNMGNGVETISDHAFLSCTGLTSVTIANNVKIIGEYAFSSCTGLTSVTIANNVKTIGKYAFSSCTVLKNVTMGNGVETIGDYAFYKCTGLTSIAISDSITNIGSYAFSNCTRLASVTISNDIANIGSSAFNGCTKLTAIYISDIGAWCNISFNNATANPLYYAKNLYLNNKLITKLVIPDSVKSVGSFAFYNCTGFTSVTIGNNVESIGNNAFANCTALTEIVIPYGVESIGNSAFLNCAALTKIVIPDSVKRIGTNVLSKCVSLQSITIPFIGESRKTDTDTYQYPVGYIFGTTSYTGGTATLQRYITSGTTSTSDTYYIPSSLRSVTVTGGSILQGAFTNCKTLTEINIPQTATKLGDDAFNNCTGLKSISIPNSVKEIGDYTFYFCQGLTDITISNQITSIGNSAFYKCIGLSDISFFGTLESIGKSAFYGCTAIKRIIIPNSVMEIGDSAFEGCTSLDELVLSNSIKEINAKTFKDCIALKKVIVPNSVAKIGASAFQNCSMLTEIFISGSVQSIDNEAFSGCSTLNKAVISIGITTIGDSTFQNCSTLTEIVLPSSVQKIGNYAFSGCSTLNSLVISDGVKTIGDYAFQNCFALTEVIIPNSVESMGSSAFSGCKGLKSMTIPFVGQSRKDVSDANQYPFGYIFGTESYDGSAAYKQTYLTKATSGKTYANTTYYIPTALKTVTVTGGNILCGAFRNCAALQEINIPEGIKSIGDSAFFGCLNLKSIDIPSSVTSIDTSAFRECISLTEIVIPDSVKTIGSNVFGCCIELESITVPFIGKTRNPSGDYQYPLGYFFMSALCFDHNSKCVNTTQSYYVAGTSTKESATYYIPYSLKKVTVTDGDLFYGAFYNCKYLTTIVIGEGVLNINKNAFYNCNNLEQFDVDENNPNYCSVNRILYNKAQTNIICSPANHSFLININYVYVNGGTVFDTDIQKIKAGDTYNFEIPQLPGYSTKFDTISGIMPAEDIVIEVIYYENDRLFEGKCNDSINWTLYSDGMLVVRGIGDMPNYTTGGAPWSEYSDKIQTIYIDPRITSIGSYAFEGCSNMTFIDYGYSVKKIGEYAFSGCSSIVSFKLPDSVTVISKGAFSGCKGLKNVVISDYITLVDDNAFIGCDELIQVTIGGLVSEIGDNAFADCGKLTQVYFRGNPAALGNNAFGRTDSKYIYYYSSVNGWDEVITDGLWNGYTTVPYNAIAKENFTGTNVYIIKVVDKHNTPLVGAVVELGNIVQATNTDGMAYFVKPVGAQELTVSCNNHITFEDAVFVATTSQIMDIIELSDKPSTVQGVRLNRQSIATSVVVLNCAESNEVAITVNGFSKYTIIKYELYQGNRLIATNKTSDSSCTFQILSSAFEEGETVLVRMHTADGNFVATALNIDVIKLATIAEDQIIAELSDVNIGVALGDLGEIDFKIPFSIHGAENISVYTEGRSIYVGVNFDVKEVFSRKLSKKDIQNKIDELMENSSDINAKRDVDVNIGGYIEIEYLDKSNYIIKSSYVKLSISLKLESEIHASYYGIVGVYFKIGFSATGQLELYITDFDPEDGFELDELDLSLENALDLEAGVFILWGAGSGGAFGTLTMGFTVGLIPTTELKTVYITGEFGFRWKLGWGLLSGQYSIGGGPKDIYRWPEEASTVMLSLYSAKQDPNSYTENDRSYLANRTPWLYDTQDDGYLQKNIYDNVAPEVVTCGDTTMMVWLDDNSQRNNTNFQMLYYSVYRDAVWSEPMAVCDNGTFDCEFDIYTDGEKIYIIYTEMKDKLSVGQTLDITDMESIEAFVGGVEVSVIVYENGNFGIPVRLTENNICEQLPTITEVNGIVTANWFESNSLGLEIDNSECAVISSMLGTEGWNKSATLTNGHNSVSDITSAYLNGKAYTAYIVDADGIGSTPDDQVLVLRFENGDSIQLDTGVIANVDFTAVAGTPVLTWYNNGQIYMIADEQQQPISLVPENVLAGADYQIVTVSKEQTLLFFTKTNYDQNQNAIDGTDIYSVYIDCNGALSFPVRITQTEGYVTSYSVYAQNEDLFVVFTETFANISEGGLETVTHFRTAELEFCFDIAINNVEYDLTKVQPSSNFNIKFGVTNTGTNYVDGVTLNFYDHSEQLLYTVDCDVELRSGESEECEVTLVMPQSISGEAYVVEILPQSKMIIVEDSDSTNNRTELSLAYTDMYICAEQKIIGEKNFIIVSVINDGNMASTAMLEAYVEDKLITELKTDVINPGSTEQYLIDINALTNESDKVLTCIVVSDFTDPYVLNDTDTVYLLHIKDEMFTVDPEEAIRNPEISINIAEFDKYVAEDITLEITVEADSFAYIEGLTLNEAYSINNGIVTISSTYLSTLDKGTHTLNFVFKFSNNSLIVRSLTVVVNDTTPIVMTGSISISGEPVVGGTVYADISKLSPNTSQVLYTWSINGQTVGTNSSYTIRSQDDGKVLKLTVTGVSGFEGTFADETIVKLRKPETPNSPVISKVESTSFTLVWINGVEYSLDCIMWQDSNVFFNLLPNETYTCYVRSKATETNVASDVSVGTTVTTLKFTVAAPTAPALQSKNYNTIVLVPNDGMEYRIEGGEWTESNTFTGLQVNTTYVFYQRYKETYSTYASEASTASFTTDDSTTITATLKSAAPGLGADLSLTVYADISATIDTVDIPAAEVPQYVKLRVTMNGKTTDLVGTLVSGNQYSFKFKGIAPQCIGDEIDLALVYNDGEKDVIIDTIEDYSIVQYCQKLTTLTAAQLGTTQAKFDQLKTLIADLVAYSTAAQDYINYKVDSKPTVSGATPSAFVPLTGGDTSKTATTVPGLNFKAATLYFYSTNVLQFDFEATDITGVTVKINDKERAFTCIDPANKLYRVETDDIYAIEFEDVYTIELLKNGEVAQTLTYSVKSYVYSKQGKTDGSGNPTAMAILAQRTWNYGQSAKAYAAK